MQGAIELFMGLPMHSHRFSVAAYVLAATAALGLVNAANAATFTNGDFETPIANSSGSLYGNGDTGITGWTVIAPGGNIALFPDTFNSPAYPAESGHQWIDLTGSGGSNQGLQQAFDTQSGHTYSVTFGIGAATRDGSTTSIVDPYINGLLVAGTYQYTNAGTTLAWQDFSFTFIAAGVSTTIGFFNGDPTGSLNGLDNVRISDLDSATPLPATLPMFAGGAGLFGFIASRRKRKAA